MKTQAFLYVLHFDVPLEHAQHYIGCTVHLRQRLEAHATGGGSRLCQVLKEKGIPWRLGGLSVVNHTQMRRLERQLKDMHNAPRYCSICTQPEARFPESVPYPIDEIKFPIDSTSIVTPSNPHNTIRVRLTTAAEPVGTMLMIRHIADQEKDALGWIPIGGKSGLSKLHDVGLIAVVSNNSEDVGYAAFSLSHDATRCTIHQCCVRDDARLLRHGQALVQFVAAAHPTAIIIAKVRDDLAANHFWSAVGFTRQRTVVHPTSRNAINHYYLKPRTYRS